jgi:mercuric ion transport protein
MNIELIYDADCPNVTQTRSVLIKAFARTGVSARWQEWERSAPDSPEYARSYGSPTILVDGEDVAGTGPITGTGACRVYSDAQGKLSRTPPLDALCSALSKVPPDKPVKSRWQTMAVSFPAIGVALMPKLVCPLCFPAYAALLSAVGIEFVDYTPYLLPLTIALLAVVVGVLAWQAKRDSSNGPFSPFVLGIFASAVVLLGKFGLESGWLTTSGIVLLIVAVVFGSRRKSTAIAACPACATGGGNQQTEAH